MREVRGLGHGSSKWHTARVIARQRTSAEAQEGFAAFTGAAHARLGPAAGRAVAGVSVLQRIRSPASRALRGAGPPERVVISAFVGGFLIDLALGVLSLGTLPWWMSRCHPP